MSGIRSILCASDLSEGADEAIRQADSLAKSHGAALEVVYVIHDPLVTYPALAELVHHDRARAALEAAREKARGSLTSRVALLTAGAPKTPDVQVLQGQPYAAIVSRAEKSGADLIVIGCNSASGLRSQRLGEVAERVVLQATVSVLVARRGPGSGKILAATDLSNPSLPALTAAAEEARLRGAKLTVAHIVDPEKSMGSEVFTTVMGLLSHDFVAELGRVARSRLADALERLGIKGEPAIESGPAGASILRLAETLPADLVVIGNMGSTDLASVLLGSVAATIVRWAPCSVLVVRRRR